MQTRETYETFFETLYIVRCAKHKSECKKMQVELGCFIAHLSIVEGNEDIIKKAEALRINLFDPIQGLEKIFDVTPDGRPDAMFDVQTSFSRLDIFIGDLVLSPHIKDALYLDKVKQWSDFTHNGWDKIYDLVDDGKFVECLEFIHKIFFSDLEMAMSDVIESLMTFEEKSASVWLATQKIGDFERRCAEYINLVFSPTDDNGEAGAWPVADENKHFIKRFLKHRILCNEMRVELEHLVSHYIIIGGDKAVIEATNLLKDKLLSHAQYLEDALRYRPPDFRKQMSDVIKNLLFAVIRFQSSLYHQKHAFYFRKVKQWVTCLWAKIGAHRIMSLLRRGEVFSSIKYMHETFLSEFEQAMLGITQGEDSEVKLRENLLNSVPEELKTFGKEFLPKFSVDEMERDTTRYANVTTIATFFSSVTATTLQFTYAPLASESEASESLRGVVNLFWFLSLIFSVSSGVSSLLGLTWRRSSIYDPHVPPMLINMWFDKAPMLFLAIAAVAFVIGLNLFAYLSLQPLYVSLATNILTGLHGMCLLVVTIWFIYHLKREWAQKLLGWFEDHSLRRQHNGQQYQDKTLHLQRNFFWAFANDNRVANLNYVIGSYDWDHEWPGPYLLSKGIRSIAYPIKKGWLVTKKALSDLGHSVLECICVISHTGHTENDVETGEIFRQKEAETLEDASPKSPAEKAKYEFRRSLQKVFSDTNFVSTIMVDIDIWEGGNKEDAKRYLTKELWGYQALLEEFLDDVQPFLDTACDTKAIEGEEETSHALTSGHPDLQPETYAVEETTTSNEVEEVLATSENTNEGSHVVKGKKELEK